MLFAGFIELIESCLYLCIDLGIFNVLSWYGKCMPLEGLTDFVMSFRLKKEKLMIAGLY